MKFSISKLATKDLEKIWLYTYEHWSLEQADRYIHLIFDEIEYLSHNPQHGKNYNHVREGYFCSRVKSHLVFYRVNRKTGVVEVIRILHQQMDVEARLTDSSD